MSAEMRATIAEARAAAAGRRLDALTRLPDAARIILR
jgi:hypothetical protein